MIQDVDCVPSKAGQNASPPSFQVLHPPPLVQGGKHGGLATIPKPMRVASSSTTYQSWGNTCEDSTTPAKKRMESPRTATKYRTPRPPSGSVSTRPGSAATLLVRLQENPRAVIEAHLPQLAGASTAAIVNELEADRAAAEAVGDLARAQERVDMIRAVVVHADRAVQHEKDQSADNAEVSEKAAQYRNVVFEFTNMWEAAFHEYDTKAEDAIASLQREQQQRYEETEGLVRSELAAKRLHYSRKVLCKREELDRLIALKHYKEADCIRRRLTPLEEAEESRFEEALNATLASKVKSLRRVQESKMEALRMRIVQGREDMMLQRKNDYFKLLLKHANGIEEAQQSARRQSATDRKTLSRQLNAMLVRSSSKPMDLEHLMYS